jgi:phospholipase/lecithinase/hemolysin
MRIRSLFAVAALAATLAGPAAAARFNQVIAFGDSLSDPGNAAALSGGAFPPASLYPFGTFSNGPTAVEYLAASYGVATVGGWPNAAGANNFAVGGARVGTSNYNVQAPSPPGLGEAFPALVNTGMTYQIARFAASSPVIDPSKTLFTLWGAPNDFFLGFHIQGVEGVPVDFGALVQLTVVTLSNHIGTLAGLGARHILVPNMPDLGLTPDAIARGPSFAAQATFLSDAFNAGLASAIAANQAALAPLGIKLYTADTAATLRAAAADPAAFGLTNVDTPCLLVPGAPTDCTGFLYYDGVHPTTYAHAVLAEQFRVAVVPEPATWAIMLLGLAAVGGLARRRR